MFQEVMSGGSGKVGNFFDNISILYGRVSITESGGLKVNEPNTPIGSNATIRVPSGTSVIFFRATTGQKCKVSVEGVGSNLTTYGSVTLKIGSVSHQITNSNKVTFDANQDDLIELSWYNSGLSNGSTGDIELIIE